MNETQAMFAERHQLEVDSGPVRGQLVQVLVGNGRYYGGSFSVFREAILDDGKLDVVVLTKFTWWTVLKALLTLPFEKHHRLKEVTLFQTERLTMTSVGKAILELEGELVGELPATVWLEPKRLRLIVP